MENVSLGLILSSFPLYIVTIVFWVLRNIMLFY